MGVIKFTRVACCRRLNYALLFAHFITTPQRYVHALELSCKERKKETDTERQNKGFSVFAKIAQHGQHSHQF